MGSSGSLPPPTEGRKEIQGHPWGLYVPSDRQEGGVGWQGTEPPEDPPDLPQPQSTEARGTKGKKRGWEDHLTMPRRSFL